MIAALSASVLEEGSVVVEAVVVVRGAAADSGGTSGEAGVVFARVASAGDLVDGFVAGSVSSDGAPRAAAMAESGRPYAAAGFTSGSEETV